MQPKDKTIGFDLKAPCSDCPFKKSSGIHEGVAGDLVVYAKKIKEGEFAHTCHKTDVRAGAREGALVNGKVQHCIGAILMCEKSGEGQLPYLAAWCDKKFELNDLQGGEDVMTLKEMVKKYYMWAKGQLNDKRGA